MRPVLFALALTFAAAHARAQDAGATSIFSVNVRVVAVDGLVRDRNGELIHHLTKDDFILTEDGRPQTIRYFTEDENLPLTIGLMVDTSVSQQPYFAEQQLASRTFLTNMLTHPQDNAFVVRFDSNVSLLQKLTSDRLKLAAALGRLRLAKVEPLPPRQGPTAGTLLFDAICGAAYAAFGDEGALRYGRRALVVLTDGEDNGSTKSLDEAIQCAELGDVTVYTVLYSSNDPGPRAEDDPHVVATPRMHLMGRTTMERISRSTGGRLLLVSKKQPIETIFELIETDLRNQYRIGYTPPASPPFRYHDIELKPLNKQLKIQSRVGYYTPK